MVTFVSSFTMPFGCFGIYHSPVHSGFFQTGLLFPFSVCTTIPHIQTTQQTSLTGTSLRPLPLLLFTHILLHIFLFVGIPRHFEIIRIVLVHCIVFEGFVLEPKGGKVVQFLIVVDSQCGV